MFFFLMETPAKKYMPILDVERFSLGGFGMEFWMPIWGGNRWNCKISLVAGFLKCFMAGQPTPM